ncbi:MAG TPA: translation initiation factor [Opitutales bacterium]|nr:translation initiation factor [Opitutales bacterium]
MREKNKRIDVSGGSDLSQGLFADLDPTDFPQRPDRPSAEIEEKGKNKVGKPKNRGRIEIRREKAGRGGKTVTTATRFSGVSLAEQEEWVRELKKRCGSGGTFRQGTIEIQGDRRNDLMHFFTEKGFRPVLAGG